MAIQTYLEIEGKRYILPVNPAEIKVKRDSNNQVVEVVKLGEVNQPGSKTLAGLSISSVFPKKENPHLNPKATKKKPTQWVSLLTDAKDKNKRARVILTDCDINILALIESFETTLSDSTGDIYFEATFKEYRNFTAKKVPIKKKKKATRSKPPTNKPITQGCEVICNGRLHRDSYGVGPGQTEKNARRKVNFIAKGRKCPYHVTTLDGGWRGWVTAGSVQRA